MHHSVKGVTLQFKGLTYVHVFVLSFGASCSLVFYRLHVL